MGVLRARVLRARVLRARVLRDRARARARNTNHRPQPHTTTTNHPNHPYNVKCGLPFVGHWFLDGCVVGGCLLAVRFPLANPTNPNTTTKNPPPTTNHKPQTDSHQPLCIKCGLPSCRALVCWWVCGGWLLALICPTKPEHAPQPQTPM